MPFGGEFRSASIGLKTFVASVGRPAKPLCIRLLHLGLIVCTTASLYSGYRAFDVGWSGIGLVDRPTLFIIHQTSGICIPFLVAGLAVASLVDRIGAATARRPLLSLILDVLLSAFHHLILICILAIALLGLGATSCGNRPLMFLGILELSLHMPRSFCMDGLGLFGLHRQIAGLLLPLVLVHSLGAVIHDLWARDRLLSSMFSFARRR